jgi:nicotinamidase-related amidase
VPTKHPDLHGNVPDEGAVALLLIDVINDLEFPGGEELRRHALAMAPQLAALKRRAKHAGVPVLYVNDNFGQWRSDLQKLVHHCLYDGVRGQLLVELLRPQDDDYFVLKPKPSGFFGTTLDLLLRYLRTKTLVLTGVAGNICVHFTAMDAYMRDYQLVVPADCVASGTAEENRGALEQMQTLLKADIRPSAELDFSQLIRSS